MLQRNDILWKGILEDLFADFLRFFYTNADEIFDIDRGFEFLDKELEQLYPGIDLKHPKFVDKLVKVYRKSGEEEWLLIHIEVQGYDDGNFAHRMFTYTSDYIYYTFDNDGTLTGCICDTISSIYWCVNNSCAPFAIAKRVLIVVGYTSGSNYYTLCRFRLSMDSIRDTIDSVISLHAPFGSVSEVVKMTGRCCQMHDRSCRKCSWCNISYNQRFR